MHLSVGFNHWVTETQPQEFYEEMRKSPLKNLHHLLVILLETSFVLTDNMAMQNIFFYGLICAAFAGLQYFNQSNRDKYGVGGETDYSQQ